MIVKIWLDWKHVVRTRSCCRCCYFEFSEFSLYIDQFFWLITVLSWIFLSDLLCKDGFNISQHSVCDYFVIRGELPFNCSNFAVQLRYYLFYATHLVWKLVQFLNLALKFSSGCLQIFNVNLICNLKVLQLLPENLRFFEHLALKCHFTLRFFGFFVWLRVLRTKSAFQIRQGAYLSHMLLNMKVHKIRWSPFVCSLEELVSDQNDLVRYIKVAALLHTFI